MGGERMRRMHQRAEALRVRAGENDDVRMIRPFHGVRINVDAIVQQIRQHRCAGVPTATVKRTPGCSR